MRFWALSILTVFSLSCGSDLPPQPEASETCNANGAVIGVFDAHQSILCGCDEDVGSQALANQTLVCTVPAPATIVFQFVETSLDHQILFDSPTVIDSSLSQGDDDQKALAHSVTITDTGSYTYSDALLKGTIVVR